MVLCTGHTILAEISSFAYCTLWTFTESHSLGNPAKINCVVIVHSTLQSSEVVSHCVQDLLLSYQDALEAGHKELLEKEVIFGDDLERILRENPPVEITEESSNGSNGASDNGSNGAATERVPVGAEGSAR